MERLDKIIADFLKISRSDAKDLIENDFVNVEGYKRLKPSLKILKDFSKINIKKEYEDFLKGNEKKEITKEDLEKVKKIYEDEYIYIIKKDAGLITESSSSKENTLVDILKAKKYILSKAENESRDGIVHRLDKDTSGILIITKKKEANTAFLKLFKERKIIKKYLAIVKGIPEKEEAAIDIPIKRDENKRTKMTLDKDGKEAFTRYKILKKLKNAALLDIRIYTGRTHQIRLHLSYINHPILGDTKYGNKKNKENIKRQMLHAYYLEFTHPFTNERKIFKIDMPNDFKDVLDKLE